MNTFHTHEKARLQAIIERGTQVNYQKRLVFWDVWFKQSVSCPKAPACRRPVPTDSRNATLKRAKNARVTLKDSCLHDWAFPLSNGQKGGETSREERAAITRFAKY